MPHAVLELTVFVASPGDVARERDALGAVVDEINRTVGGREGFRLTLKRWETHARPAAGRPQGVINGQLGPSDLFVGILWKRLGTPTGKAASGTVEEFEAAHAAWQRNGAPQAEVLFYFSEARVRPSDVEPEQLAAVQAFRARVAADHLVWTYRGPAHFADIVRPHLIDAARAVARRHRRAERPQRPTRPIARSPKRYTDAERRVYLVEAFTTVERYFLGAAEALRAHRPRAHVAVLRLDEGTLYAEGAVDDMVRSRCRIWIEGRAALAFGGSRYQRVTSEFVRLDALAVLKEADGALAFTLTGTNAQADFALAPEEVAERFWLAFVRKLGAV